MTKSIEEYMKENYPSDEWYYVSKLSSKDRKVVCIAKSGLKLYFKPYKNDKGEISWSPEDSNGFI